MSNTPRHILRVIDEVKVEVDCMDADELIESINKIKQAVLQSATDLGYTIIDDKVKFYRVPRDGRQYAYRYVIEDGISLYYAHVLTEETPDEILGRIKRSEAAKKSAETRKKKQKENEIKLLNKLAKKYKHKL